MNKSFLFFIIMISMGVMVTANNIENIYGKNDLDLNNNYIDLYGNNFGSILELDNLQPHFIDVTYANAEIQKLGEENVAFLIEVNRYKSTIEESRTGKAEINQLFIKIDLLLVDLTSTSAELYYLKTTLTDREMRQKLQLSIEENRQQVYDLNNKRNDLESNLNALDKKISFSDKFITVNNLYIRRNNKMISYLKECRDYSNKDNSVINTAVQRSTSFQNEVNDLLNVSF